MDFLVAYDIADPKRLRRVARFLERHALRCQKSVFRFHGDESGVRRLLEGIRPLLLGRGIRPVNRAVSEVRAELGQMHQALRSPVAAPALLSEGVDWLGVRLRGRVRSWDARTIFGYLIPDERVVKMLSRLDEMTVPPSDRIGADAFNLSRWLVSINEQLREWQQAYRFADNALEVFRAVDDRSRERVGALLASITGLRRYELRRRHYQRLPRGFWTWQVDGCRLVVLSSQAPESPVQLTRRPPWMRSETPPAKHSE